MATTKTVTIDTGEWAYPDSSGVTHQVTNGQTFTFSMTDNSATDVQYKIDTAQTATTTDGLTLYFRPRNDVAGNEIYLGPFADADDNTTVHGANGELEVEDPTSGHKQIFRIETIKIDDVDAPTSITAKFCDQFGNEFSWDGVTVA